MKNTPDMGVNLIKSVFDYEFTTFRGRREY